MLVYDFVMEKLFEIRALGFKNEDLDEILCEIECNSANHDGLCFWFISDNVDPYNVVFTDSELNTMDALYYLYGRYKLITSKPDLFKDSDQFTAFQVEHMNEICAQLVRHDWYHTVLDTNNDIRTQMLEFANELISIDKNLDNLGLDVDKFEALGHKILELTK